MGLPHHHHLLQGQGEIQVHGMESPYQSEVEAEEQVDPLGIIGEGKRLVDTA